MKGKKLVSTLLATLFVFSILAIPLPGVNAVQNPVLAASDHSYNTAADLSCTTDFNVTISVTGVTNMKGCGLKLGYNATLITAVRVWPTAITASTTKWLPTDAGGVFHFDADPTINNTRTNPSGFQYVWINAWGFTTFTGSGDVFKIQFHIAYAPPRLIGMDNTVSCALDLYDTEVLDAAADPITHDVDDGTYTYTRIGITPGKPVADFTWSPTFPYECTTVTLTSTSTPNGGAIVAYLWSIANGTGSAHLTGPDNTAVTTFHCDGKGTVDVTLTVWDDEGMNDTVTKTINQLAMVGAIIDLYTSNNRFCGQVTPNVGVGMSEPCDALTEDVNITLFAKVTWGGAPVTHVYVAFEVWWNWSIDWQHQQLPWVFMNQCITYRTAETDKDGIARIWFRVPNPCTYRIWGKWVAYAACKVQEVKISDIMPFDVGRVITLIEVETDKTTYIRDNPPYHGADCISYRVTFKNIMWIPKELVIVAVAYDACDVPIGQKISYLTVPGGRYCSPYHGELIVTCQLPVPQWAYVGTGKLYVSAFTRLPRDCGVAYCAEVSTTFLIEYAP